MTPLLGSINLLDWLKNSDIYIRLSDLCDFELGGRSARNTLSPDLCDFPF